MSEIPKASGKLYDETGALTVEGRTAQEDINKHRVGGALLDSHERGVLDELNASRTITQNLEMEDLYAAAVAEDPHREKARHFQHVADNDLLHPEATLSFDYPGDLPEDLYKRNAPSTFHSAKNEVLSEKRKALRPNIAERAIAAVRGSETRDEKLTLDDIEDREVRSHLHDKATKARVEANRAGQEVIDRAITKSMQASDEPKAG